MIKGDYHNHLCFGYGDIAVRCKNIYECFRWFKPAQEIGTHVDKDVEWLSPEIHLEFKTLHEVEEFKGLLEKVKRREIDVFDYKWLKFDFSNYDEKSVDVVLLHLHNVTRNLCFLIAA